MADAFPHTEQPRSSLESLTVTSGLLGLIMTVVLFVFAMKLMGTPALLNH